MKHFIEQRLLLSLVKVTCLFITAWNPFHNNTHIVSCINKTYFIVSLNLGLADFKYIMPYKMKAQTQQCASGHF